MSKLVMLLCQRFSLSSSEAIEAISEVKRHNGGTLRGMPKSVFLNNVEKIIKYKNNQNEPMPKKKESSCDICFLQLSSKQAVTRHIKIVHSEKNKTELSETDDLNFSKIEELKNSDIKQYIAYLVDNIVNEVENFSKKKLQSVKCNVCGKHFSHAVSLKRHSKIHSETPRYFQCSECDFKSLREDNLFKHERAVHNYVPYDIEKLKANTSEHLDCKMCKQKFENYSLLETHIISKCCQLMIPPNLTDGGRHKCDLCPSSYSTKWDLLRHIDWKHKSTEEYKCNECLKIFYNQYSLKRHKKQKH